MYSRSAPTGRWQEVALFRGPWAAALPFLDCHNYSIVAIGGARVRHALRCAEASIPALKSGVIVEAPSLVPLFPLHTATRHRRRHHRHHLCPASLYTAPALTASNRQSAYPPSLELLIYFLSRATDLPGRRFAPAILLHRPNLGTVSSVELGRSAAPARLTRAGFHLRGSERPRLTESCSYGGTS